MSKVGFKLRDNTTCTMKELLRETKQDKWQETRDE